MAQKFALDLEKPNPRVIELAACIALQGAFMPNRDKRQVATEARQARQAAKEAQRAARISGEQPAEKSAANSYRVARAALIANWLVTDYRWGPRRLALRLALAANTL